MASFIKDWFSKSSKHLLWNRETVHIAIVIGRRTYVNSELIPILETAYLGDVPYILPRLLY